MCEYILKTQPHFQMLNYKMFKKSQNENRKGFAISKLHPVYTGGKNFSKDL